MGGYAALPRCIVAVALLLAVPSSAFVHGPALSLARARPSPLGVSAPSAPPTLLALPTSATPRSRPAQQLSMALVPNNLLAVACTAPTLLGFWRSEYGVSYAYGGAMLFSGLLALNAGCPTPIAALHALCFCLYGLRLNLFLLYRELNIPSFKKVRERIEEKAQKRGNRLTRAPFLFFCSLLYMGMVSSMQITGGAAALGPITGASVGVMFFGFLLAALGDQQKTMAKLGDPDKLVTSGLFSVLRHPNFTGEFIMWSASFVAGLSAATTTNVVKAAAGWLVFSLLGTVGIGYVLAQAATNLEKRQAQKYSERPEYQAWVAKTWAGPTLPRGDD